ncbi:uncharacterized protein LOC142542826 isoform X2 [Primulina tabacum]|uniref:uncharacterized protein LOC142542826 isoform X2 n=1 Tax=Primulina tabacum TaxID=48773 RepID=UPI003F5A9CEE
MGLHDSYGPIRSQILLMSPLPSVSQAYSLVSQEESHRHVMTFQSMADAPTTAFYSSSSKHSDIVKCDHCSIPGHLKENCFRLIGYPPGHKLHKKFPQAKGIKGVLKPLRVSVHSTISDTSATPADTSGVTFTPTQYAQILRLLENSNVHQEHSANLAGTSTGLQTPQPCPLTNGSVRLPNGTLNWEDNGDW